jgi:hypothetical protein
VAGISLPMLNERGQPHAVRRKDSREWVKQDGFDAEELRDLAGVLPTGTPEHDQRVSSDIVAAGYRDLGDGLGHVGVRDAQHPLGDLLIILLLTRRGELLTHSLERVQNGLAM